MDMSKGLKKQHELEERKKTFICQNSDNNNEKHSSAKIPTTIFYSIQDVITKNESLVS